MQNLKIYLPLVDGALFPLDYETGRELIREMVGDDWGAPPHSMVFEATMDDGRTVRICVPYSDRTEASVTIESDEP